MKITSSQEFYNHQLAKVWKRIKIMEWLFWYRWQFIRQIKKIGGLSKSQIEILIGMNIFGCKSSLFIINDIFRIARLYK